MNHIIRGAITASLIYWAVWLDSRIGMTIMLALICLANEASAFMWKRKRQADERLGLEMDKTIGLLRNR